MCSSEELSRHVDFGEVPLGNNLQETAEAARAAVSYPLILNRCCVCGHFQLSHAVAPELLYATNYTYLSGIGPSFIRHFADYADWVHAQGILPPDALVIDVGSNDGTCLKAFQTRGYRVCGVDPASLAAGIANENGIDTINAFFDAAAVCQIVDRHGQADFVTSHNVSPRRRSRHGVPQHPRSAEGCGHFAFESAIREVLRTGCFDPIYHEHLDIIMRPRSPGTDRARFELVISASLGAGGSRACCLRKTGGTGAISNLASVSGRRAGILLYDEAYLAGWRDSIVAG